MVHSNFHPYIDEYLNDIIDNPQNYCESQHAFHDFIFPILENSIILPDKIEQAVNLVEDYFFKLYPLQKFYFACLDGIVDKEGYPVFDEYLFYMGRGAGKNGTASGTALYLISNRHGVQRYNVDIVATSEEQAKTSFEEVYNACQDHPFLDKAVNRTKEKIEFKKTRSTLSFKTSNPKTKDGGRPGAIIFDEIHAYENESNITVHTGGLGKVDNPRRFLLTTDGYFRGGYLDERKEFAKSVLFEGEDHNGMLPLLCHIDNESEVHDKSKWIKANPRIPYSRTLQRELNKAYNDAKNSDDRMADFMTKRMNFPKMPELKTVATWEEITDTNRELPDLRNVPCIGMIDYASLKDFCAVGLLWYVDGTVFVKHHSFIHESAMERNYKFPIREAVEKGLATIVSDPVITGDRVANWFIKQAREYPIHLIVADEYRFSGLQDAFLMKGIELTKARSGYITHSKLHPLVTNLFAERKIVFGDDMLMRWYTNNVAVHTDNKGNKRYDKIEQVLRKTDGFFMLLAGLQHLEDIKQDNASEFFLI